MQTGVGPKNYVVDGVQIPTRRGAFEGDDVGISMHGVDQHSDWPAALCRTVECHTNFSQ